ncbi:SPASM domain-containing protein, partial [bacterium]|nr:SPASM domain-containing protein [bacterium]
EDRKKQAEKDLFLNHIHKRIAYHKKKSKSYRCPAWDFLVIDETGQLLLCCGVTRYDSDHVLGNILEMSAKEIWNSKSTDPLCNECLSSGLARWCYNQDIGGFHDKSWPSGGGLHYLKLWSQCNLGLLRRNLGRMVREFLNGEKIIHMIKRLRQV